MSIHLEVYISDAESLIRHLLLVGPQALALSRGQKLGTDLVHSQIVPQKVFMDEIKKAIDKVCVRPNAVSAQDILIKCMSRY